MKVKDNYENGECPDCGEVISDDALEGDECPNCGHVLWEPYEDFDEIYPRYEAMPHPCEDEYGRQIRPGGY